MASGGVCTSCAKGTMKDETEKTAVVTMWRQDDDAGLLALARGGRISTHCSVKNGLMDVS